MRHRTTALLILSVAIVANAQPPAAKLWNELKEKREALTALHQEFEVSRTYKFASGEQASKWQIVLDMSHGQWREKNISGSGTRVHVFDGNDLFTSEEGEDEFVHVKRRPKDETPLPAPYGSGDPEWQKAVEVDRRPCGLPGTDQTCAIISAPLKSTTRMESGAASPSIVQGQERVAVSIDTGFIVYALLATSVKRERNSYVSEIRYSLKRVGYGGEPDASLFKLADGMHEVKELSKWNAARIKKQLGGKPAPELAVTDLQGKQVTLASLKGKTVLLDFWATWCGPCRADGPALDKLYKKYGEQELAIIGISVSEDRAIVEKFLKEHPHAYPIVLTSENEIPRPFQIGVFPTYIVIEKDGTLAGVVEGDQGFSDLRKLLKKAGMEVD
jgi:thiol-disulfide isomerase/thioredoxin